MDGFFKLVHISLFHVSLSFLCVLIDACLAVCYDSKALRRYRQCAYSQLYLESNFDVTVFATTRKCLNYRMIYPSDSQLFVRFSILTIESDLN
jgi:hypothetical protein